ncbi:MAG TPA: peptidylprolyl isomerase [Telluria sp.]|nr:peptidylprolyl isomerase [Telluria sp.]
MISSPIRLAPALLALALLAPVHAAQTDVPAPVFARVGDTVITHQEYEAAFVAAARSKFYHGKPPEAELARLQRDVGEQLVARVLLLREADKRGIKPDTAAIDKQVAGYEARYAASAKWKEVREQALPPLVRKLEQESLLAQLEAAVRAAAVPSAADVAAYYAANPAKFTEPQRSHVAVILLPVEPSAPTEQWVKVDEQAQALLARVKGGEDFAALARQYSADSSAAKGGDMGYLHDGMLPDVAEQALAALQPGGVTDTLRVLQGVAVFRLLERTASKLHPLEVVKVRAGELAQRDLAERRWRDFRADLLAKASAQVDTSRYLPLPEQANPQAAVR